MFRYQCCFGQQLFDKWGNVLSGILHVEGNGVDIPRPLLSSCCGGGSCSEVQRRAQTPRLYPFPVPSNRDFEQIQHLSKVSLRIRVWWSTCYIVFLFRENVEECFHFPFHGTEQFASMSTFVYGLTITILLIYLRLLFRLLQLRREIIESVTLFENNLDIVLPMVFNKYTIVVNKKEQYELPDQQTHRCVPSLYLYLYWVHFITGIPLVSFLDGFCAPENLRKAKLLGRWCRTLLICSKLLESELTLTLIIII